MELLKNNSYISERNFSSSKKQKSNTQKNFLTFREIKLSSPKLKKLLISFLKTFFLIFQAKAEFFIFL